MWHALFTPRAVALIGSVGEGKLGYHPVSYTHLTLPTIYSV